MANDLVLINNNRPITTSRIIAKEFNKQHKNILRDIRNLESSPEFNQLNFELVEYIDSKGESRPEYLITKDGFTFLCMGFTGEKAAEFKEKYIIAFNNMEDKINNNYLLTKSKYNKKKICKTFITADINTIQQEVYNAIEYIKEENKPTEQVQLIKSITKGLDKKKQLLAIDNLVANMGYIYTLEHESRKLLEHNTKLQNRINGGQKTALKKELRKTKEYNTLLTETIEGIEEPPDISDYNQIDIHGFSNNFMYNTTGNKTYKTTYYQKWIDSFPIHQIVQQEVTIDSKLYISFICKESLDIHNLTKSFIDRLATVLGIDDKIFINVVIARHSICNTYQEGKILYIIK